MQLCSSSAWRSLRIQSFNAILTLIWLSLPLSIEQPHCSLFEVSEWFMKEATHRRSECRVGATQMDYVPCCHWFCTTSSPSNDQVGYISAYNMPKFKCEHQLKLADHKKSLVCTHILQTNLAKKDQAQWMISFTMRYLLNTKYTVVISILHICCHTKEEGCEGRRGDSFLEGIFVENWRLTSRGKSLSRSECYSA